MNLRQINHPGVIQMHGICFNPLAIVMEYIPNAITLQNYLLDKKQDATWPNRLEIAIFIAETMDYFSSFSPQFCHVNLQSSNVLVYIYIYIYIYIYYFVIFYIYFSIYYYYYYPFLKNDR
jgi:hypothetical protein